MKNQTSKLTAVFIAAVVLIILAMDIFSSAKAKALAIIRKYEGLLKDNKHGTVSAYLDPVGIPTIGYGTIRYASGVAVRMGDTITYQQANDELHFEVDAVIRSIDSMVKVPITSNQKAALISFTYNLGAGTLQTSTLLKLLNGNADKKTVAAEFDKWVKAGGNTLAGLVKRRAEEKQTFLS